MHTPRATAYFIINTSKTKKNSKHTDTPKSISHHPLAPLLARRLTAPKIHTSNFPEEEKERKKAQFHNRVEKKDYQVCYKCGCRDSFACRRQCNTQISTVKFHVY